MIDYQEHFAGEDTCVVAFASGDADNIIPSVDNFEFGNSLKKLGISYVLLRDSSKKCYSEGIPGLGNLFDTVKYVSNLKNDFRRVVLTGVSVGSHGALLYGQLGLADEVIAISPLTVVGQPAYAEFTPKWHHRLESPIDLDLKPYYPNGPETRVRVFVSDGDGAELDLHMATRLGIEDVTIIPGHSHTDLARHMRDTGWFERLYS